MCGINGLISKNKDLTFSPNLLKKMNDAIRHRGLDDEGYLIFSNSRVEIFYGEDTAELVINANNSYSPKASISESSHKCSLMLGHRRLSIIDLSASGHQPMCNEDKLIWIVFNGEIYNYIELRNELINFGYILKSESDTEVIIKSYERWGFDCVNHFNGMWSFAIFDIKKMILFLSRDRFGVKPLYYYNDSNYLAFSSEIKALVQLPFIQKSINNKVAFEYLAFGWQSSSEETFFKEIFELEPSYNLILNLNTGHINKYKYFELNWNKSYCKFNENTFHEYSGVIKNKIIEAVDLRLRSDVPVGSCLSGGIDSSTIVCIINFLISNKKIAQVGPLQKVFTASYPGNSLDESKWAKLVVDSTQSSWFLTYPKKNEFLDDVEKLIYIQDYPFVSSSVYAQYRIMKLANENGIKVLIDGQGGDELFAGYKAYYRALYFELFRNKDLKQLVYEFNNLKYSPITLSEAIIGIAKNFGVKYIPNLFIQFAAKKYSNIYGLISNNLKNNFKDKLSCIKERGFSSLNSMLYEYLVGINLKSLLRYEDRNSMAFSIEARTPFADDIELINYVFSIPSSYKIHNGWSKSLLREAIKGLVPDDIRFRKDKIGFATPEKEWISEMKDLFFDYLDDDLKYYINVDFLKNNWYDILLRQPNNDSTPLWRFINFAIWKKKFI